MTFATLCYLCGTSTRMPYIQSGFMIFLYINLDLRFNYQANSLPISDVSLIHFAKLLLFSLTARHAFLPKIDANGFVFVPLQFSSQLAVLSNRSCQFFMAVDQVS